MENFDAFNWKCLNEQILCELRNQRPAAVPASVRLVEEVSARLTLTAVVCGLIVGLQLKPRSTTQIRRLL